MISASKKLLLIALAIFCSKANKANDHPINSNIVDEIIAKTKSWQPYAPVETPGINPNLPKVPGPVRQSHHNQSHSNSVGKKGHTGNLSAQGKSASTNKVRSYSPYAQYPASTPNAQAAEDLESSTRVKGSLLHWARHAPKQQ